MKRFVSHFLALSIALVVLSFISLAQATSPEVPTIEQWEETVYPFGNADMGHPTKIVPKWHKDPRGDDYEGAVIYYKDSNGNLVPFAKSWNFKNDGDWSEVRTALLTNDGNWVTGNVGEMLSIKRQRNAQGDIVSVTYQFTGTNVSRTIELK